MRLLVKQGVLRCGHDGRVENVASQHWVRISGSEVLVEPDPQGRSITACPNIGASIKPCTTTLVVREGYSHFVSIDGRPVCLETVVGYTDGTPPGVVEYTVREPGQSLVRTAS